MTTNIHPTAVIAKGAQLGINIEIGPYCVIGPHVRIGDNCKLHSHVVIEGRTTLGEANTIFPFASIGHEPQDLKYRGEPSTVTIGDQNTIREYSTIQPGTAGDKMATIVGNNNTLLASIHVAHDCTVGSNIIMSNNATLAGHVTVEDYAIIGGLAAVHQFVRIGHHAMIGGMSGVEHDVIPYGLVKGERAKLAGINLIGMKRRGYNREQIDSLKKAYEQVFAGKGTLRDNLEEASKHYQDQDHVMDMIDFIRAAEKAVCTPSKVA